MEYQLLLVEDDALVQRAIKRMCERVFRESGHLITVTIAADGSAARQLLENKSFSHVLCDMEFPNGDACAIHLMATAANPQMHFVANTGNPQHDSVKTLRGQGVTVLIKPYLPEALKEAFGLT